MSQTGFNRVFPNRFIQCQYNTQCCSQRCLSFSYKCVPNPHEHANPGHFNQNNNIPQSTVFEVGQNIPGGVTTLEELANRFGDNNAPNNAIAPPPPAQSAPVQPVIPIAGSQVNRTNCLASGAQVNKLMCIESNYKLLLKLIECRLGYIGN